jgi:hypothetical protein
MLLGRTPWQRECVAEELLHLMADRKQQRKGIQTRWGQNKIQPHGHTHPRDIVFPDQPHLLKFLQPLKIMPPALDKIFNT